MTLSHGLRSTIFLSTPSGWRATLSGGSWSNLSGGISIHALRVEGDRRAFRPQYPVYPISIHALRVEGDRNSAEFIAKYFSISIHALRVEGDHRAR